MTLEIVQSRLKQLDESKGIDDDSKAKARDLLHQALEELESKKDWSAAARRFEQMVKTAPEELVKTKAELAALPRQVSIHIPEASLAQLEQTLSQKESELAEKKAVLAELEAEPKRRAGRRVDIPKLIAEARQRLTEIDKQLQPVAPTADALEAGPAKRLLLLARRQALEQEHASYEKELKAYEVRTELLPVRRDLAAGRVALAEQELATWRQTVNRQRQHDAEVQLRRANREAEQAHPAIADLTRQNAELAERRKEIAQLIVQTTKQLDLANQKLTLLEDQFKRTQGKVDAVGQTNAIGLLLRKQRESMPDISSQRQNIKARQPVIRECQLELLQLDDRRSDLANLEAQIQKELASTGPGVHFGDQAELEADARAALETEKDYLDKLIIDLNAHFDKLIDLDNAERQLTEKTEQYIKYIDERVLWISSTSAFDLNSFGRMVHGAAWLADPQAWLGLAGGLFDDFKTSPLFAALAAVVFGPLIWSQRRLRRKVAEIGEAASRSNCCSLLPTIEAVFLTALMCSVVPGILWYISWRLTVGIESSAFCQAVAAGLAYVAAVYVLLDLLEQTCRTDGVAEAHFEWPVSALKPLRQYVRAAKLLILPLLFVTMAMDSQINDRWADSLGRASFVAAMFTCALLVQRSLRPKGGIHQAMLAARGGGWLGRLHPIWCPLAVLVPSALAILAVTGYYYTAQQLGQRMVTTAYVLLGLALVRSFLLRWILVNRRKLAIRQARQRRAAAQADLKLSGGAHEAWVPAASSTIPPPAEPKLDLATINVQTRHFVEYSVAMTGLLGLWLAWVDVLPALKIFDRIPLWQAFEQTEATSLADLSLAVVAFATALIAAKNAPGLLEMALLGRLPLDAGFRYTIGTVSRYVIIVIGLLVTCHILGLSWGTVQWLVAALGVGLGFGLQEIFANFVSGLIILFERPVRVGDVVTVDEITGVISRIHIRATTITNWDRKEFIVPNKEFITGRVLNWTLSDQVNRIVLTVGVAYGSDTNLATELLMKVARKHPLVLDEPDPRVTFEEFGDSSLKYVLRCFLADMENRLQVIHDLHMAVDHEFRSAGIEIAFPQQDVHVRSIRGDLGAFARALGATTAAADAAGDDGQDAADARHVA